MAHESSTCVHNFQKYKIRNKLKKVYQYRNVTNNVLKFCEQKNWLLPIFFFALSALKGKNIYIILFIASPEVPIRLKPATLNLNLSVADKFSELQTSVSLKYLFWNPP